MGGGGSGIWLGGVGCKVGRWESWGWQLLTGVAWGGVVGIGGGEGKDEGGGGGGGKAGGGRGGGRCKGRGEDAGDSGEEGEMGDGSGGAAVGTERVVEREVLGVDEGLLGGIGGRG